MQDAHTKRLIGIGVAILMVVLAGELWLSVKDESQTFDEAAHIYSGYSYWTRGDFGMNPEHPPLVKLVAALPLLSENLKVPPVMNLPFKVSEFFGGLGFLYSNKADALLFRARFAVSVFTFILALAIFAAGYEMFGYGAGILSLLLFAFDPNILANGGLVGTDMGVTCCLFVAVYAFYRYVKHPSTVRLIGCGVAAGLTLAAKHPGLVLFPILALLAIAEILQQRRRDQAETAQAPVKHHFWRRSLRGARALIVILAVAVAVLWAFYGFRFQARPGKLQIDPPLAAYLHDLHHLRESRIILALDRWRALPEAYLYGLSDVLISTQEGRFMFLLGKLYPEGRWFYFPVTFIIKSTLGFLGLLLLLFFAKELRGRERRRELFFMAVPPAFYFGISLTVRLDLGLRHILPIYPFLIVLAGAGAWSLMKQSRRWTYLVVALLAFHAVSSLRAFPAYLPYSNEIWGGPGSTYKVLTDSNLGWEGGLKAVEEYVRIHHVTKCWFAYSGTVNPAYYHIPCHVLPTFTSEYLGDETGLAPPVIDGTMFMSAVEYSGFNWGPGSLNPYRPFTQIKPAAILQGEVLVFKGRFSIPAVSAVSHLHAADRLANSGHFHEALAEAQVALALNPRSVNASLECGSLLSELRQPAESHAEYQRALALTQSDYPQFQEKLLALIQQMVNGK
jgi:hypothetical protein